MNKTVLAVIVLIIIIAGGWYFTKGNDAAPTPALSGPVKIGFIGEFSGDAAIYGESGKNGVELALKEINDKGGIGGQPVEIIYEDGKCNGKDAANAAQKLVNVDKVKFIVGPLCSGEVLSAAPIIEAGKVVFMVNGSSPDITNAGEYIFRTWPSDTESSKMLAEQIISKFKKVAIITEQTEYPVALAKFFKEEYESLDGQVVAEEVFTTGVTDFRSSLTKIKASNPEAIFINPQTGANASRIAKQARDLGIKAPFYAAFFTGEDYVKAGSQSEGTIIVDVPVLDPTNAKAKAFMENYTQTYGKESPYPFHSGALYDQLYILAKAIEASGYDADKVKDYLYDMPGTDGVIGKVSFDDKGDVEGVNLSVRQVKNGEVVNLEN